MFPSKVAVYHDNRLVGTKATTADSNFDTSHPVYSAIADLAKVRLEHVALRRGDQVVRNYADKPGLFAVSRIDNASGTEVLAVFNTSNAPLTANVEIGKSARRLSSVRGNCPASPRLPGSVAVSLPPLGYILCNIQ
jgi:hypothetical protein